MTTIAGLQTSIWQNRMRTIFLILLFPIFLFGLLTLAFGILFLKGGANAQEAFQNGFNVVLGYTPIVGPIILIRGLISFAFHRQIIFKFSGAKAITRKEYPDLYNIVENLCISRGLSVPSIGILEDDSCNAFAIGRDVKKSWIVFSRGIINRLNKQEIEAVAGHELTHIINKDSLVMITIIVYIGIIATLGEIFLRIALNSKSSDDKKNGQFVLILLVTGVVFLVLGYLIFPLIRLAISRKREYLADAGSVELTKDKNAMISALEKISQDPVIESIKKQTVAAMCIANPFDNKSWFKNMLSTHPSIEDRVKTLQNY